jgi:urease gamma subunit
MRLTPWEEERLLIFSAAELARRHHAAGLLLNHPEAVALICDAMLEAARAGGDYERVEAAGRAAVREIDLIDGVRDLLDEVRLEVLLGDGSRLVVLVDPLGPTDPLGVSTVGRVGEGAADGIADGADPAGRQ